VMRLAHTGIGASSIHTLNPNKFQPTKGDVWLQLSSDTLVP
jgi:hypothetical protein